MRFCIVVSATIPRRSRHRRNPALTGGTSDDEGAGSRSWQGRIFSRMDERRGPRTSTSSTRRPMRCSPSSVRPRRTTSVARRDAARAQRDWVLNAREGKGSHSSAAPRLCEERTDEITEWILRETEASARRRLSRSTTRSTGYTRPPPSARSPTASSSPRRIPSRRASPSASRSRVGAIRRGTRRSRSGCGGSRRPRAR